ncbi:MAG: GNAT family N-acetyltransferase [Firmicutes bacterium]|nr:GNAT family N-acetyltransferase [Bacillota bacterium]
MQIRKILCTDIDKNREAIILWLAELIKTSLSDNSDRCIEIAEKKAEDMRSFCLDGSARLLGAFEGEKLCGFLWAYKHTVFGEDKIHITQFYVDREYRNCGVASALLDGIKRVAHEMGVRFLDLNVKADNLAARRLYKKFGFTEDFVHMTGDVEVTEC